MSGQGFHMPSFVNPQQPPAMGQIIQGDYPFRTQVVSPGTHPFNLPVPMGFVGVIEDNAIALSGLELLALGREARQIYGYMDYGIICKIEEVIKNALNHYSSIFAVRVDLRFTDPEVCCPDSPVCFQNAEGQVMKRFIASLQSQLTAYDERRIKAGVRIHPTKLRYLWVCEQNEADLPHYHLFIVLNKAAYWRLNNFHSTESLAGKIKKAWCSALALDYPEYGGLVHFPENCEYVLTRYDAINRSLEYMGFMRRALYLAKLRTKICEDGRRRIGSSRR